MGEPANDMTISVVFDLCQRLVEFQGEGVVRRRFVLGICIVVAPATTTRLRRSVHEMQFVGPRLLGRVICIRMLREQSRTFLVAVRTVGFDFIPASDAFAVQNDASILLTVCC